jgi:hypothetical protein
LGFLCDSGSGAGNVEHKLFVGNMNKTATEEEITEVNTSVCFSALLPALIGVLASKGAALTSARKSLSIRSESQDQNLSSCLVCGCCFLFVGGSDSIGCPVSD